MFKSAIEMLLASACYLADKPEPYRGDFSKRIKSRHKKFWKDPCGERIRNTIMSANDSIEKWKDVENWQRKLSNKYNARQFAEKHGCKVAKLYWKGRDYTNINFDNLPEEYVIRPTNGHSLNLVFLFNGSVNLMDGKKYSKEDIKKILAAALDKNPDLEFLVEEFVRTEHGEYKIPDDYKFYMFGGEIACIQVINRLNNCRGFTSWYDENWNFIPNLTVNYPEADQQVAPLCLSEMAEDARKLSTSYKIFSRIDFYATDKGSVFGEFTPTPARGKGFTQTGDKLLSYYWDRYCRGMI